VTRQRRERRALALSTSIRLLTLGLLTCACYGASDWEPSEPGHIFRHTVVGRSYPLDSIVLGEPWPSARRYGARDGDTLTSLPTGVFSGAEAIRVRRNASGVVTQLEFDYGVDRDITKIVREYEEDLGTPAEVSADSVPGQQRRVTVWRNAETEFRILQFTPPRRDRIAAIAILSDR
jgi:hypothetical protein